MGRCLLSPLEEALWQHVLTNGKFHVDDTPVPVGNKKTKTVRLWTYVRDDRNAGAAQTPAVWFAFSRTERISILRRTWTMSVCHYSYRLMLTPSSMSYTGPAVWPVGHMPALLQLSQRKP